MVIKSKDVKICKSSEKFVTVSGEVCTTKGEVGLQVQDIIHKFQIMPKQIYITLLFSSWERLAKATWSSAKIIFEI